jgi:glutathione S-transferase
VIKLYGVTASRAGRVVWMLEELGVEYEQVPTSFVGDAQKPEYLAINPNGRIPALDDGGFVIWESLAINLYLAEKYDGGLRPRTLEDRALAVQWSLWAMTEIEPGVVAALMNRVFLPEAQRDAKAADAGEAALQRPLAVLDAHLARRRHLLGDAYSVADVNVASVMAAGLLCQVDFARFPHAMRWLRACADRPAARKAMSF